MSHNLSNKSERALNYRSAKTVMNLNRLGTLYPYPLSFMRTLTRRILREKWDINRQIVQLCDSGFGHVIYTIKTPNAMFSYVVFAKDLDPEIRSDRVIAEDWDITVTLCEGEIDDERLDMLKANVPLQEKGRVDSRCIVLSRANNSLRNFKYVVDELAEGRQPDLDVMAKIGYLCRTTAVYGSGKFGMADWDKVRSTYPDFATPFAAEMFSCFLIRDFSLFQVDHIAKCRAPQKAVAMDIAIKRYVGIGNATGLGMAPYLINHPLLINNWIEVRETALARVKRDGVVTRHTIEDFKCLVEKALLHLDEISTDNIDQNAINAKASRDMSALLEWFNKKQSFENWIEVTDYAEENFGYEAQELLHAILCELFPDLIYDLEDRLNVIERYEMQANMLICELKDIIETQYAWALNVEFKQEKCTETFWYRSEEKQEPRLGLRRKEPGVEKEMLMGIAKCVRDCYDDLSHFDEEISTARFAVAYPQHRYIIRRMQTMAKTRYGEIQANLLDADVLPIHLLRCKLSFFGVGKFNPRSRLWVRNTMFQGAPLLSDIGFMSEDNWCFPIKPKTVRETVA